MGWVALAVAPAPVRVVAGAVLAASDSVAVSVEPEGLAGQVIEVNDDESGPAWVRCCWLAPRCYPV